VARGGWDCLLFLEEILKLAGLEIMKEEEWGFGNNTSGDILVQQEVMELYRSVLIINDCLP
jgi:hypothetical protein